MIFEADTIYSEHLAMAFGQLDGPALAKILSDGRVSSHLIYNHLPERFSNLRKYKASSTNMDCLTTDDGDVYQLRIITANGVKLVPSKNVGVGRGYDRSSYRSALDRIVGFILVDVTDMPKITYGSVPKGIIPFCTGLTRRDALSLLSLAARV